MACSLGVPPLPWQIGGPGRGIRIRECPMPPFPHRERHPGTGIAIQDGQVWSGVSAIVQRTQRKRMDGRQVAERRSS